MRLLYVFLEFQDGQLIFRHEAAKSKGVVCMQILGNLLFAGCYNGNIYVYNIKTNAYLGSMVGPGGLLLCMTIVQDMVRIFAVILNFIQGDSVSNLITLEINKTNNQFSKYSFAS